MIVNVTNEGRLCRIGIEGEMTIYYAAQAKDELLAALSGCEEIEMNLGQVSEIDAAGLQLLALIKREALAKNITLSFIAHTQAVLDMLDLCNLAGVFGDPVVISPA
ncbi:MAG: STAS domain-containing protein [Gallionellaceae bacterium]